VFYLDSKIGPHHHRLHKSVDVNYLGPHISNNDLQEVITDTEENKSFRGKEIER
jgi:hypothetical protein